MPNWDAAVTTKHMYEHHVRFPDNQSHWRRFQKRVWDLDVPTFQLYVCLMTGRVI